MLPDCAKSPETYRSGFNSRLLSDYARIAKQGKSALNAFLLSCEVVGLCKSSVVDWLKKRTNFSSNSVKKMFFRFEIFEVVTGKAWVWRPNAGSLNLMLHTSHVENNMNKNCSKTIYLASVNILLDKKYGINANLNAVFITSSKILASYSFNTYNYAGLFFTLILLRC